MPRRPGLKVVNRKGSSALYLRGTIRGIRIFESAGTDDAQLVEEAHATREAELYRAAIHGERPRVTFAAAALEYLSNRQHSQNTMIAVGRLVRRLGPSITCDQVDQAAIDRAARSICRPNASPTTKQRNVVTPAKAIQIVRRAGTGAVHRPSRTLRRAESARSGSRPQKLRLKNGRQGETCQGDADLPLLHRRPCRGRSSN